MTEQPSGRLYSLVTKHWPKIAAVLVGILGLTELVLGGLTANSSVEFYLMAWAGTTGGLWFLFEEAEKSLSEESREKVVDWVREADFKSSIESIPDQFAVLFDRVFGVRHLSVGCFFRSCIASLASVAVVATLMTAVSGVGSDFNQIFLLGFMAAFMNVVPDYVSLLETRWAIGWMERTGRIRDALVLDLALTTAISGSLMVLGTFGLYVFFNRPSSMPEITYFWSGITEVYRSLVVPAPSDGGFNFSIYFYSAFFTSVWLWLYAASVPLSRLLLRMNSGVGFLLRVTDVEKQPFRSMGFVSVIITSVIFALGLPLVLL